MVLVDRQNLLYGPIKERIKLIRCDLFSIRISRRDLAIYCSFSSYLVESYRVTFFLQSQPRNRGFFDRNRSHHKTVGRLPVIQLRAPSDLYRFECFCPLKNKECGQLTISRYFFNWSLKTISAYLIHLLHIFTNKLFFIFIVQFMLTSLRHCIVRS